MNFFKSSLFLLAVVSVIGLSSCNDDDPCVAPELAENIIGTWNPQLSGGQVEFQTDGTLIDPDDSLFGIEVNGVVYSEKTWSLSGTTLTLTASVPGGGGTSSTDYEVTQNECDELKVSISGLEETLKRN